MNENKEVLVITDNALLAKRFENEVLISIEGGNYQFSFGCSPFTKLNNFKSLKKSIIQIDLRRDDIVEALKSKYLIISLHCKQIFPNKLVKFVRCINVHPGYNPINRGWYPQVFSIAYDLDIGATIHEIDKKLDHGKIIARSKVSKFDFDTSLSLYNRVVDKEIELLKEYIVPILRNSYIAYKPEEEGVVRWRRDFDNLCKLDLEERLTLGEAIARLRALTHEPFKNAFFKDESGRKIYLSLKIDYE